MAVPALVQQRPVQPPLVHRTHGTDPRERRRHGGRRVLAATRSPADQTHRRRPGYQGAWAIDFRAVSRPAPGLSAVSAAPAPNPPPAPRTPRPGSCWTAGTAAAVRPARRDGPGRAGG